MLDFESSIKIIHVTREEEGVGICAGAYLAGKKPFMCIQSSGLGNMFNALASLIITYKIPLLILASYRGYKGEKIPAQVPLGKALPNVLDSLRIPYIIMNNGFEELESFFEDIIGYEGPIVALFTPRVFNNA